MVIKENQGSSQPPKIEFPCPDYPVKVLGISGEEFHQFVLSIFEEHAPGFDPDRVSIKDSNKGTFQSMTVFITATGEQQLKDLNTALRASDLVKMVL